MAGLLAIFAQFEREILRERVKAGIAQARRHGKRHGRPPSVAHRAPDVQRLTAAGLSQSAIARQLGISRTSVWRFISPSTVSFRPSLWLVARLAAGVRLLTLHCMHGLKNVA